MPAYFRKPAEHESLQPLYNTAASPALLSMQGEPRVSFPGVTAKCFPLRASRRALQDFCDYHLNFPDDDPGMKNSQKNYFRPAVPYVYFQVVNYGLMATESENLGWIARQEILFSVPLKWYRVDENGVLVFHDWAIVCPFVFVDDDLSLTAGREAYGWCKARGLMNWEQTSWTGDPRTPQRILSMAAEVYPDHRSRASLDTSTLLGISQQQPPPLSPGILMRRDRFNPLWVLPNAVRGSISLIGDMLEIFDKLPDVDYRRRKMSSLGRLSARALRNMRAIVPWLPLGPASAPRHPPDAISGAEAPSPDLYFNQITLKQFRDAAEPRYACYQALVNSRITVDHYHDAGLLAAPSLVVGDVSGGFTLEVHDYPEYPIVQTLGLEVDSRLSEDGKPPVSVLKPIMPFWSSADLRYDAGTTLAWRGKTSVVWDESPPFERGLAQDVSENRPQPPGNRFNIAPGPASHVLAGPFNHPDATLRVFPLLADPATLQKFCDEYLNHLDGEDEIGVHGHSFEPWGSYVYLVVTSYGTAEGGEDTDLRQIADREVSFCVPVRWMETSEVGAQLKTVAILTPWMFASSRKHVISEREINGRHVVHSDIRSDHDSAPQGPGLRSQILARVATSLIPELDAGQPAAMRDLIEISGQDVEKYYQDIPWALVQSSWDAQLENERQNKKGQMRIAEDRWDEIVQIFEELCPNRENLNFLTLKQYRGAEWANRACYQALVLLQRKIEAVFDFREMHGHCHVKIHRHSIMPIVESLGLKVKATDSKEDSIIDFLEPVRPFFMRVAVRDELGKKICSRVNSRDWASEANDSDHHAVQGLNDEQRSLLDMVSEPKAVVEYLLSDRYGEPGHARSIARTESSAT